MKLSVPQALLYTAAMAAVIFLCRAFPFLFFHPNSDNESDADGLGLGRGRGPGNSLSREAFLSFVEKTVPPVAMTVLAANAIGAAMFPPGALASPAALASGLRSGLPALAASALTVLLHLWKRNPLLSIFGGTALYMLLSRWAGG